LIYLLMPLRRSTVDSEFGASGGRLGPGRAGAPGAI
jgi:hypothetical protein